MKLVHVAVGVLIDRQQRVLVALRNANAHQGGLWEFPGGKCEAGEDISEALRREFFEEIGIEVMRDVPLCDIRHDYGDKQVWLEVRRILDYRGEPTGKEGQAIRWQKLGDLNAEDFPAANKAIIDRIQLPDRIAITGKADNEFDFLQRFERALAAGVELIHLRQDNMADALFAALVAQCWQRSRDWPVRLAANTSLALFKTLPVSELHINSAILSSLTKRPVAKNIRLSASCHSLAQLQQAQNIGVDYVFLSPVAVTQSHPGQVPIGWEAFASLVSQAKVPVYALGGMGLQHIDQAMGCGAAGIAAISAFWEAELEAN